MAPNYLTPMTPPLPGKPGQCLDWYGLPGAAPALAIANAAMAGTNLILVAAASSQLAQQLETELRFFGGDSLDVQMMPDWETLPYDVFSPHQDIVSQRLRTLYRLPTVQRSVLIVPIATLIQRIAPVNYLEERAFLVQTGERMVLDDMRTRLERSGYRCVSQVMEHGEFAVRGSILDLFPMGSDEPYRIDLFDDEIDSIRTFDPESQRSRARIERIELLPAREFPTDEAAITRFRGNYRSLFEGDPTASLIYREVSEGRLPNGIEYYLPLFFQETATLFDYLPGDTLTVVVGEMNAELDLTWHHIQQRYEQRRHDRERPLLAPKRLYLAPDELRARLKRFRRVRCHEHAPEAAGRPHFAAATIPDLRIAPQQTNPLGRLQQFLQDYSGRVLFIAESAGRREDLLARLQSIAVHPQPVAGWSEFLDHRTRLGVAVAPLEQGVELDEPPLALLPETALFAGRAQQRRRRQGAERDPEAIIRDLTDLHLGTPVVHKDHGVGRYRGLQIIEVGGITTEFLTIEYAGGDKLYAPVSALHLVTRYTGMDPEHAPLHRLGGEQWERACRRAAERARDVAAELLEIYARRAAAQGHAYCFPRSDYEAFSSQFPFEETPDQQQAIDGVLSDLESSRPMDRVVCGDVGFGKTEVAMRAAFIGVQDSRQVAVLVPTTLLAQQHFRNFRDRFADWPIRIEQLSRFRSSKEQNTALQDLAAGKVDIVIGTHKLLQDSVRFKNLGLVIIDEEHRFGVRQKEQLKRLRTNVDVLMLTATPIPRTLNMALAGLRDMSIIATPPARRLAVKTFVNQWNDALIQEACLRELHRGGQVYFLHNEIRSIERIARQLHELIPDARVRIAHGQMRETELERVMLDFYHQRFNVLVCTTIIESGIDVPSANTIIINRADRLGLARLYQLRGRVGRSHHRAYAYLIAPPKNLMTPDAVKRLEAIASLEDLGVGFSLASHDLEIRGAGELLGDEQSGQIQEVGFTLYSELLERAVQSLRAGREPVFDPQSDSATEVDLRIPALLPEDYLPDIHARLVMYKRIASSRTEEALRELQIEMIDRFGLFPQPVKNLFRQAEIRLRAERIGIIKVEAGPRGGILVFRPEPDVNPATIVRLIHENPSVYRLEGQERLQFRQALEDAEQRIATVAKLLDRLAEQEAA
ncbi:transcription-repair coupling factor [Nitrococcus mobilis]|nr:transcription-repair coupling factor [Nitrococcus mobilis]